VEVDKYKQFYLGMVLSDKWQQECAQLLMEDNPYISKIECDQNVLELVSGLSNIYLKNSSGEMFARALEADVVLDHDRNRTMPTRSKLNKKSHMTSKFMGWGIPQQNVVVFPNLDVLNGCEDDQKFLGVVSHTICLNDKE
jgi:hypothetical protein